jgi:hypothetical protein
MTFRVLVAGALSLGRHPFWTVYPAVFSGVACSAPKAGLVEDLVPPPIVSRNGADFAGLDEL